MHVADETRSSDRRWLWIVLIGGIIEVLGLLAGAILLIVALVGGFTDDTSMAIFVLVFGGGMGIVLAIVLRQLSRGKRWARGPLVTWQLFQLAVAIPLLQGATPWIGIVLLVLAALVIGGLFTPAVLRLTTERSGPSAAL